VNSAVDEFQPQKSPALQVESVTTPRRLRAGCEVVKTLPPDVTRQDAVAPCFRFSCFAILL